MAKVSKIRVMLGTMLHRLGVLPCSSCSLWSVAMSHLTFSYQPYQLKGLWAGHTIPTGHSFSCLLMPLHTARIPGNWHCFTAALFTEVVGYWFPVAVAPQQLFDYSNPEAELTYEGLRVWPCRVSMPNTFSGIGNIKTSCSCGENTKFAVLKGPS